MSKIDNQVVNTIRILSAEGVQKAKSGHPGLPMGSAPIAYSLWAKNMKHNPLNPEWKDRDRFILSAGHGSMLIYSLLHLFGYGLTMDDLKNFRQLGSKTPGHPEYRHTRGVETTTGPLGQGFANGVGMAMAEAYLAAKFNRPGYEVVNHNTYVLSGDGCLMEGITSEAASLAGTLKLGKLVVLYDSNNITIEGNTDIAFREDVGKRFEAYGWQVLKVDDGNDVDAISKAVSQAKAETGKPSLIIVKTQIGFGCPAKQGKSSAHGEPLGEDNLLAAKQCLGMDADKSFYVSPEVSEHMNSIIKSLSNNEKEWNSLYEKYEKQYPELASEFEKWYSGEVDPALFNDEYWSFDPKPNATRSSSGEVLNRLANIIPNIIGGSADLAPSNKSAMKGKGDFSAEDHSGANLHFGVREHAMASIGNGLALHGGLIPYVATFFVFSDYMKGAMRLSALMGIRVVYILTHDSIGVGEDGPTHEPIEQLASLRSTPGFTVFRPADSRETAAAWYYAVTKKNGPTALVLSRQNLPQLDGNGKDALKGGYTLVKAQKKTPDAVLIATGSEVHLAVEAAKALKDKGIDVNVVSMPSWELFDRQPAEYRESVLPNAVRARLAIEAGSSFGWQKYTGLDGDVLSIDTFGASGPADQLFVKFGLTVENVINKTLALIKK